MTTALYRRYRPDTFQDVIGQEHVTAPLMAALRADRVTHAYLFSGPRGCGKTTSARILARCLNCEQFPTDTPCGTCPSCRDLATGGPGSLDVVEIDAASHNGVDDARDLRERASFAPARDRFKIFILDEAHMVTPQGFNALLKLVEEPPAHVKFIFATTEPEKVIGTIRSRTHHYPFRLVAPDTLEAYLAQLCASEGVQVGAGVFPLVTRAGGGSVRDTLSVMDQLIGGAVDGAVDYQRAVALLGYTDTTMLDQCIDAIAGADGAGVFRVVDRVIASGHDPRRFVEDLLQRLRDLLVIALAGAEAGPALGSVPVDQLERMEVQARTLGSGALSRYADTTAQALTQMVGATSPRLQLELLMARLLVPASGGRAVGGPAPAGSHGPTTHSASAPQAAAAPHSAAAPQAGEDGRAMAARLARQAGARAEAGQPEAGRLSSPAGVSGVSGGEQAARAGEAGWGGHGGGSDEHAGEAGRPDPAAGPDGVAAARGPEHGGPGYGGHERGSARGAADSAGPSHPGSGVVTEPAVQAGGRGPADVQPRPVDAGAHAAVPAASDGVPAQAPAAVPDAGGRASSGGREAADAEMIRTRWSEVLDAVRRMRRVTWALIAQHAQPGSLRAGEFTVLFSSGGLVSTFDHGGHAQVVSAALSQALGVEAQCRAVLAGGSGDAAAGGQAPGGPGGPGGSAGPAGSGGPGPAGAWAEDSRNAYREPAGGTHNAPDAHAAPRSGHRQSASRPDAAGTLEAGESADPARGDASFPGLSPAAASEDAGSHDDAAHSAASFEHPTSSGTADERPRGGARPGGAASDRAPEDGASAGPVRSAAGPRHDGQRPAQVPAEPVGWGTVAPVGRNRSTTTSDSARPAQPGQPDAPEAHGPDAHAGKARSDALVGGVEPGSSSAQVAPATQAGAAFDSPTGGARTEAEASGDGGVGAPVSVHAAHGPDAGGAGDLERAEPAPGAALHAGGDAPSATARGESGAVAAGAAGGAASRGGSGEPRAQADRGDAGPAGPVDAAGPAGPAGAAGPASTDTSSLVPGASAGTGAAAGLAQDADQAGGGRPQPAAAAGGENQGEQPDPAHSPAAGTSTPPAPPMASGSGVGQGLGVPVPDTSDVDGTAPEPTTLATVHRLHKLPDIPTRPEVTSAQAGSGVGLPEGEDLTHFSDGVPVPEEPGDSDGPAGAQGAYAGPEPAGPEPAPSGSVPASGARPGLAPDPFTGRAPSQAPGHVPGQAPGQVPGTDGRTSGPTESAPEGEATSGRIPDSVSAAMAAARAAARGDAPPPGAPSITPRVSLEDDIPSDDDEDAEEAGVVGLEVVKRILGATVLEDLIINREEY